MSPFLATLRQIEQDTPLVLQEAKARQLPVAATTVGGIPDLFEESRGWFPLSAAEDTVVEGEIVDLLSRIDQNGELLNEKRQELRVSRIPVTFRQDSSRRLAEILQEVCP